MFRVGTDDRGQFLDIGLDLRHATLIINKSGCNARTKSVTKPREKLQNKVVSDSRKSQMRHSYSAKDRLALVGGDCRTFSTVNEGSSRIRPHSAEACNTVRYLVETPSCITLPKTRTRSHNYSLVDSNVAGDPVSRKSTTGCLHKLATIRLTSLSVGEAEFYAVVKESQIGLSLRSIYMDLGIPES